MSAGTPRHAGPWARELRNILRPETGAEDAAAESLLRLGAIGSGSLAAYGAIAGLFQGGAQILESALKAPLIVGLSLLLCLPSLYVLTTLSGVSWEPRRFASLGARFFALTGVLLVGLLPIAWLFSVSSRYLAFVTLLHVGCWLVAIILAGRSLASALHTERGSGAALWSAVVFFVALQVATNLRPVLWREPQDGWRPTEKRFFLEHFSDSARRRQAEPPRSGTP